MVTHHEIRNRGTRFVTVVGAVLLIAAYSVATIDRSTFAQAPTQGSTPDLAGSYKAEQGRLVLEREWNVGMAVVDLTGPEAVQARLALEREWNVGMAVVDLTSPEAEQSRLDLAREWDGGADTR